MQKPDPTYDLHPFNMKRAELQSGRKHGQSFAWHISERSSMPGIQGKRPGRFCPSIWIGFIRIHSNHSTCGDIGIPEVSCAHANCMPTVCISESNELIQAQNFAGFLEAMSRLLQGMGWLAIRSLQLTWVTVTWVSCSFYVLSMFFLCVQCIRMHSDARGTWRWALRTSSMPTLERRKAAQKQWEIRWNQQQTVQLDVFDVFDVFWCFLMFLDVSCWEGVSWCFFHDLHRYAWTMQCS